VPRPLTFGRRLFIFFAVQGSYVPSSQFPVPSSQFRKHVLVAAAVSFAALYLAPLALGGLGPRDPRTDLAAVLLLATGAAAVLGPLFGAPSRGGLALGTAGGTILAAIATAIAGGVALAARAVAGTIWPLLLLITGFALARGPGLSPRRCLLGSLPALAFLGSIFVVGPLLTRLDRPGDALSTLLLFSPVTALTGSLLELDLLRKAPLYAALPVVSEAPFAYPPYARTLLAPAIAAALSFVVSLGHSMHLRRGPSLTPDAAGDKLPLP
jgi:hypothetical protein